MTTRSPLSSGARSTSPALAAAESARLAAASSQAIDRARCGRTNSRMTDPGVCEAAVSICDRHLRSSAPAMFRHKASAGGPICITAGTARRAELRTVALRAKRSHPQREETVMKSPTPTLAGPALGIALCMAAWPAHSEPAAAARSEGSKESNIGAVSGLGLGAGAAGPIGAVVGLAAGAVLGDAYHRRTQDLRQSETERARLTQQVAQSVNEAETRAAQLDAA